MSTKRRLRDRGLLRSLEAILASEPRSAWERSRLTRATLRANDTAVQLKAAKHQLRRNLYLEG